MVLQALSEITVSLITSLAITGVFWLVLFVVFGKKFNAWLAIGLLAVVAFIIGAVFDLTAGVMFVFDLALTSAFVVGSFNLAGWAPILAAVGLISIAVSVFAVIIAQAVEGVD